MKRIAWNRVVLVFCILGLTIYLTVSLLSKQSDMICKRIDVKIINEGKLVYPKDIDDIIEKSGITGTGKLLDEDKLAKVKELLETKGYLRDVVVYKTGDSVLHVELNQRMPVASLLNEEGASCYIDKYGYTFQRSFRHAYNVPLITGKIHVPPQRGKLEEDSVFVCNLLSFVEFISKHPFWNAQIQQINIDRHKNIEMTVSSGNCRISLGQLFDYEKKMKNLYVFFKKVDAARINEYKILDLRYDKQIVARKND